MVRNAVTTLNCAGGNEEKDEEVCVCVWLWVGVNPVGAVVLKNQIPMLS